MIFIFKVELFWSFPVTISIKSESSVLLEEFYIPSVWIFLLYNFSSRFLSRWLNPNVQNSTRFSSQRLEKAGVSSQKPTSRFTCQRGESRMFFFAYSPMPRSSQTGEDDIRQSRHVRLAFIMHARASASRGTTERMYFGFYARPPRVSDAHDLPSRDTDPMMSFSTLVRNKERYYGYELHQCAKTWRIEELYDPYCRILCGFIPSRGDRSLGKGERGKTPLLRPSKCDFRDDIPNSTPVGKSSPLSYDEKFSSYLLDLSKVPQWDPRISANNYWRF